MHTRVPIGWRSPGVGASLLLTESRQVVWQHCESWPIAADCIEELLYLLEVVVKCPGLQSSSLGLSLHPFTEPVGELAERETRGKYVRDRIAEASHVDVVGVPSCGFRLR